jgi:hypothetical protein
MLRRGHSVQCTICIVSAQDRVKMGINLVLAVTDDD